MYELVVTHVCSIMYIFNFSRIAPSLAFSPFIFYFGYGWADERANEWSSLYMLFVDDIFLVHERSK